MVKKESKAGTKKVLIPALVSMGKISVTKSMTHLGATQWYFKQKYMLCKPVRCRVCVAKGEGKRLAFADS